MKYKVVIFDLDGTVLNTLGGLASALNKSLSNAGYPPCTIEEVRTFIGNGGYKLVERALPGDVAEDIKQNVF